MKKQDKLTKFIGGQRSTSIPSPQKLKRIRNARSYAKKSSRFRTFYLLSYPRSGNHWVRYILEWHSKRTTIDGLKSLSSFVKIPGVRQSLPPIAIKKHWIESQDDRSLPLIFLLRNYKEAVTRHCQHNSATYMANLETYRQDVYTFLDWASPKICIYYTDLITSPKTTIKTLLDFVELPLDKDFIKNIDEHAQKCISAYNSSEKSYTGGKEVIFHSKVLSKSQIKMFDEFMSDPRLEPVLGRYYE